MKYEDQIADLGFEYRVAPSRNYARLLNERGIVFAWAVPGSGFVRFDLKADMSDYPDENIEAMWSAGEDLSDDARFRMRVHGAYPRNLRGGAYPVQPENALPLLHHAAANATGRRAGRNPRRAGGLFAALGLERRFGVELEFNGTTRAKVYDALEAAGLEVRRGRGWAPASASSGQWAIKYDQSVRNTRTGETYGLELVSPILKGEDGMRQLETACAALKSAGGKADRSCGIHIHLEMRDAKAAGIRKLVRAYVSNQKLINWLVSPSRRNGRWCREWREDELHRLDRVRNLSGFDKYKTVNVSAFPRLGTVEFRQHGGSVEFKKVGAWVKMLMSMADAVGQQREGIGQQDSVAKLFDAIGFSRSPERTYLQNRATGFRSRARRAGEVVA